MELYALKSLLIHAFYVNLFMETYLTFNRGLSNFT